VENKKIGAIRKILNQNEAAIITSNINRRYLTGFKSSAGNVIITKSSAFLIIDFRYFENAKNNVTDFTVILAENTFSQIEEILKKDGITKIHIESENITVSALKALKNRLDGLDICDDDTLSATLNKLRSIKTIDEIEKIKAAQAITDKAFDHILNFIEIGRSEKEIALELEFFMRKNQSDGVAFETIAVSGKNSSLPHGVPTDKLISHGDFITMDFGAAFDGYCSDMTRTVAIGSICDQQKLVYDTVLKAQIAVLQAISNGQKCCDMDKIARDIIKNAGFEGCFGHGLGHSLGLEIHENPACNTRDTTILTPGMIMTVEPGIYLENQFGVRIEDMVLITEKGAENLTRSPKELIIL